MLNEYPLTAASCIPCKDKSQIYMLHVENSKYLKGQVCSEFLPCLEVKRLCGDLLSDHESVKVWLMQLDRLGSGEETAVDCINDWLSANLPTTEETSIETFNGVLSTLYTIKLEVNVTLSVWIERNVYNMTIFVFAFGFDIIFEFFDP